MPWGRQRCDVGRRAPCVRWMLPLFCLACALGAPTISASPKDVPIYAVGSPNLFYHNAGLLHVMVTNLGYIGNPQTGSDTFGARWRQGEYLHSIELWVGGITGDNLDYVSSAGEFRPSRDPIDTIYTSYEGAPGGDRTGYALNLGDDDGDGVRNEEFHNGKDDDGDGAIDEDYAAISQQMFSCEYWDYTEEAMDAYPEHRPLYVKVRQRSFSWSMAGENEFIGFDFRITNEGFDVLDQVYLGFLVDADVGKKDGTGYWLDDGGAWTRLDTTYIDLNLNYICYEQTGGWSWCARQRLSAELAFMYDVPGMQGGRFRDDPPPGDRGFIGTIIPNHTTDIHGARAPRTVGLHTCRFLGRSATREMPDMVRYDWLSQGARYPNSTAAPADYAYIQSVGPFRDLEPGEELELQMILVVGAGWLGLRDNATAAMRVFRGAWRDADGNVYTGLRGRETCLRIAEDEQPFVWKNPCDPFSDEKILVKTHDCDDPAMWVDNDCSCCTPGQEGYGPGDGFETLVHWVGKIGPPPPRLSTEDPQLRTRVEGNRQVLLEWDNAPEMATDPVTLDVDFCGYRLWRVEGWDRPAGSPGPAPGEWQLLAEMFADPVGCQLNLADFTNPESEIAETLSWPERPEGKFDLYETGRYFYRDTVGLKNGMIYFYDVTTVRCWWEDGEYREVSQPPAALEAEGVRPGWDPVPESGWKAQVAVVPNPYRGGAAWDLRPNLADPLGTHVEFSGLPERDCAIRIYSVGGDLVQTLHHRADGQSGSLSWNLLTRNNQDIVSGVYLYAVTCDGETKVGRFTVIR